MPPAERVRREDLPPIPAEPFHRGRSVFQADLYAIEWRGRPALLKDFGGRPFWIRTTWGRIAIARERRILERLGGLPGTPALLARVGSCAIVLERFEARALPRRKDGIAPPSDYFPRAREIVAAMHARGIGHGDLRRDNLLLDSEGTPRVIDFATSVAAGGDLEGLLTWPLLPLYRGIDRYQLAKLEASYRPDGEGMDEASRLLAERPPWYARAGRALRQSTLGMTKARNRKKLKKRIRKAWAAWRARP